ncbi:MAG: hypothetical protein LBN42_03290 [Oscillospiraceae bacterium]|jgi:hypothetical protein|nr:hypothetical protein [Oscillospiraceae bacterium]
MQATVREQCIDYIKTADENYDEDTSNDIPTDEYMAHIKPWLDEAIAQRKRGEGIRMKISDMAAFIESL